VGKLEGKVAVITGGSSGIGFAAARKFIREGAHVYITGRNASALNAAASDLGKNATPVDGDVSRISDLEHLYATVQKGHGRLDVLFANAGLGQLEPLDKITEASFDRTFNVNVKGTLFTVQKAIPLMSNGGSIILAGSTAGVMGAPGFSVYSATKAAIRNLARSWAMDLKGTGIRVNVLSPGAVATPGLEAIAEAVGGNNYLYDAMIAQTPLGKIADVEEIASVALFLASNDSAIMTGGEVFADGGLAQV
jgi:NAD(P)-dependent dehydrogenase (short-subunit alcohol dehydrogenase family)